MRCFLIISLFFSYSLFAQNNGKPDWRTVKVVVFDSIPVPSNLTHKGEDHFVLKNKPKTVDTISRGQLKRLKKYAARQGGSIIYIDLKYLRDYETYKGGYYVEIFSVD